MDKINEFLKQNRRYNVYDFGTMELPTRRIVCRDGFSISVQANNFTYCKPRIDCGWPYSEVELGFPSEEDELINEYAEEGPDTEDYTKTVYGFVPINIVNELIEKHGGIIN